MKKMNLKKLVAGAVAVLMQVSMLTIPAIASEIEADNDNRVVWQAIESDNAGELGIITGTKRAELYACKDDPFHTIDLNGSIEVRRIDSGHVKVGLSSNVIPQKRGKAVKEVSFDIYADEYTAGSTVYGYALAGTKEVNGYYNMLEPRTLVEGWQTVHFDTTNCDSFPYMVWECDSTEGSIYIDNICVYYQDPDGVFDSFENYSNDWVKGSYTISQNTDKNYVKDGNGSLKVDCVTKGEAYFLKSRFLNLPKIYGKAVPEFNGYTPSTYGFWVYNVDANVTFVSQSTSTKKHTITEPGWHYVSWSFTDDTTNWNNTKSHISQWIMSCSKAGTIYIDAMKIGYTNNSETVLDTFETNKWDKDHGTKYISMNTNEAYVKEGVSSAKVTIPAGKVYDATQSTYTSWEKGLILPEAEEGKVLKYVGMWIYGTGTDGLSLQLATRQGSDYKEKYIRTSPVAVNWTGWKYVKFDVSAVNATAIGAIRFENTGSTEAVCYLDKMMAEFVNADSDVYSNKLKNGEFDLDMSDVLVGDVLKYDVTMNRTAEMISPAVIIVGFDAEGHLIKCNISNIDASQTGVIDKSATLTIDSDYEKDIITTVKGFVWDLNTMKPLIDQEIMIK